MCTRGRSVKWEAWGLVGESDSRVTGDRGIEVGGEDGLEGGGGGGPPAASHFSQDVLAVPE